MAERPPWHESADELEAMIRAAGEYVRPGDDLRPRVLETARLERHERRARRVIRWLAAAVLLAIGWGAVAKPVARVASQPNGPLLGADVQTLRERAVVYGAAAGEPSWGMVEVLRQVRREQSEALPTSPWSASDLLRPGPTH